MTGKYPDVSGGANSSTVAGAQLKAFFERIEHMNEEKKAVADDIREIFAEAKGNGYDTKVMRKILRRRAQDRNEMLEQDALQDLYEHAIGMAPAPVEDEDEQTSASD